MNNHQQDKVHYASGQQVLNSLSPQDGCFPPFEDATGIAHLVGVFGLAYIGQQFLTFCEH
jgi:hypothetical protein